MSINDRISLLIKLGKQLKQVVQGQENLSAGQDKLKELITRVVNYNQWFTPENVHSAIQGIIQMLEEEELLDWTGRYMTRIQNKERSCTVGLVMAGNLPMVGFHDFLSVYIVGDYAKIKMSSDDAQLLPVVFEIAAEINSEFKQSYELVEGFLKGMDKVIATGGNNTSRYFEHYFGSYPNVIRRSRTSVGVLSSDITTDDIALLAEELFCYYALGCRNVSKLFIHESIDMTGLMDELCKHDRVSSNNKYLNNLTFQKSVFLIDKIPFLDGGFFLMRENESVFSPISVLHYQRFQKEKEVLDFVHANQNDIQCVVGQGLGKVPFGEAQKPHLWDYADQVDTVEFLLND